MQYMALLCFLAFSTSAASAEHVVLASDSGTPPRNAINPPSDLIDFVLASEPDDANEFSRCMQEANARQGEERKLFTVVKLSLNNDKYPDYFVRPALAPYCSCFYGAHLFRYWFVTSHEAEGKTRYTMSFRSGGDGVRVLPSVTNNFHDLQLQSHTALELFTTTMKHDGTRYVPHDCFVEKFDNGKAVRKSRCDAKQAQPSADGRGKGTPQP